MPVCNRWADGVDLEGIFDSSALAVHGASALGELIGKESIVWAAVAWFFG